MKNRQPLTLLPLLGAVCETLINTNGPARLISPLTRWRHRVAQWAGLLLILLNAVVAFAQSNVYSTRIINIHQGWNLIANPLDNGANKISLI